MNDKIDSGGKILIVDDDTDLLQLLSMRLSFAGFEVDQAESAEAALNLLDLSRPQLVITDMHMKEMDGMALFEHIHGIAPTLPVIILTAHCTIPDAIAATQRGVFGYLTKPFDSSTLLNQAKRALKLSVRMPFQQGALLHQEWRANILTQSAVMESLLAKAQLVAQSDASVVIRGESGTGKELLARAIHSASGRAHKPFVAINCAAIPEQLLESELFGYTKGAFTGAMRDHAGLIQAAEGGTVFLDEIGDMPLILQSKLLRVLQERQVTPLGSTRSVAVDVRILSATHKNLKNEVASGRFREDMYYRLNVVELEIPSLSERREDIPLLAKYFLSMFAAKYHKKVNEFSPEAMEILISASWPGNVRQLQNIVEQSIALSTNSLIAPALVHKAMDEETHAISFEEAKRRFEREYLIRTLKIAEGNVTQAARISKRNRTDFYKLLQRHQIKPASFKK
ncbi:MAG: sigma 54-interacting transcriptional regulator [Burkholderiales bacterium]